MRVKFDEVFNVSGGAISPKGKVKIGAVVMTPGVSFGAGVSMGGVNLAEHIGKDLDVEQHPDGTVEIKSIYQ